MVGDNFIVTSYGRGFCRASHRAYIRKNHIEVIASNLVIAFNLIPTVGLHAQELIAAGADFLAVSAGVWEHPEGPEAAVKAFNSLF